MSFDYCKMATENIEGYTDYNIGKEWYKNKKPGLSAVIRCCGEERWIGACIESSLPLFDEIVVTLTEVEGDRTEDIVNSFHSPKITLIKYPFKISNQKKKFVECDSVHQFSYYTNWSLSKTTRSHVSARWDADHILRSEFATKSFRDFILSKEKVRVRSFNVVTPDFKYLSKEMPYQSYHVRFERVNPYLYFTGNSDATTYLGWPQLFSVKRWLDFPVQQAQVVYFRLTCKDVSIKDPVFFHTKFLKFHENQFDIDDRFLSKRNVNYVDDWTSFGKKIDVKIPDCVFKKPEDYLSEK